MLKERLRQVLVAQAITGNLTTYKELVDRLGLEPPRAIHRLTNALEALMAEDVAAGRPMAAALCISRVRDGIPGPGFFLVASELGVFFGPPIGPEAHAFHATELKRALSYYGTWA
jgi:hypothetical protein